MNKAILLIILLVIGLGAFWFAMTGNNRLSANTAAPVASPEHPIIEITSSGFQPASFTIKAGTTVSWFNSSGQQVSINSAVHPTHLVYPPLNLGVLDDGGMASFRFDQPGSYQYHNHFDPSQTGIIIVQ